MLIGINWPSCRLSNVLRFFMHTYFVFKLIVLTVIDVMLVKNVLHHSHGTETRAVTVAVTASCSDTGC